MAQRRQEIVLGLVRIFRRDLRCLQTFFRVFALGHVAKTPDPADRFSVEQLNLRVSLQDRSVLPFQDLEGLPRRSPINLHYSRHESFGIFEPLTKFEPQFVNVRLV